MEKLKGDTKDEMDVDAWLTNFKKLVEESDNLKTVPEVIKTAFFSLKQLILPSSIDTKCLKAIENSLKIEHLEWKGWSWKELSPAEETIILTLSNLKVLKGIKRIKFG